jgi:hypothetical protein
MVYHPSDVPPEVVVTSGACKSLQVAPLSTDRNTLISLFVVLFTMAALIVCESGL